MVAAALLRLLMIGVAEVQDRLAEVAYTDIDYQVFSEAAESVALGLSPYEGRTPLLQADATRYRYSPLLAYILLPNIWLHKAWGKLLFSGLDLVAALVLRAWLERYAGHDPTTVKVGLCLWLFNPFCFTISTRGSGESVVVLLIYGCFWALHVQRRIPLAGCLLGLAVHWRLYPVIFGLPLALSLGPPRRCRWPWQRLLHSGGILFGAVTFGVFVALGALFALIYGREFLEGAYLYHSRRLDPQHNFSVYFYPTALFLEDKSGLFPNIARFAALPQFALCFWLGWSEADLGPSVAPLLQAIALVATNKVLTAQYFVWWWAMLPLALPWLSWRRWAFGRSLLLWAVGEVHWLLWAYLLEFRRWPVRPGVWGASCAFLAAHLWLLSEIRHSARLHAAAAAAPKVRDCSSGGAGPKAE